VIWTQCSFVKCDAPAPARSARRWRRALIPLSSASRVPRQFHCHRNTPLHACGVPHAPRGPILARCSRPASLPPPTFLDVGAIGSDIPRSMLVFQLWYRSCSCLTRCLHTRSLLCSSTTSSLPARRSSTLRSQVSSALYPPRATSTSVLDRLDPLNFT